MEKTQIETQSKHSQLKKVLGPPHVWALGVGIVLVGEFMGWNFTIAKGGSLGSILACWIIGIMYIALITINTEIGLVIPEAGGQYAMAKYLSGPLTAFNVGLMLVFEYVMLEAADALVVGSILQSLSPSLNALPFVLLSLLALTYLNYKGVHATLNLNLVITSAAIVSILILFFSIRFYDMPFQVQQLKTLTNGLPFGWIGIIGALQFGVWFYLGIEGTSLVVEECRRPGRALPMGAIMALVTLLIGATLTWFICSSLVDAETLGKSVYPLFDAAKNLGIPVIAGILFTGTILACLASANGCITDASRAWFSMSRDTLIPGFFGEVHPKYNTPYRAILFLMPISLAFGYTGLLDQVITFSILSALLVYLFTAIIMIKFRIMYPLGSIKRGYVAPMHPFMAIILFSIAFITIIGMYFGYWVNLIAGLSFYMIASVWFLKFRYKYIDTEQFYNADHLPQPKNM